MEQSIRVDNKTRRFKGLPASKEALKLIRTSVTQETVEITTTPDDLALLFTATLSSPKNLPVFGIPEVSLYQDSVEDSGRIPIAALVGSLDIEAPDVGAIALDFFVSQWMDWNDSDNNNLKWKIYIARADSSMLGITYDIICRVAWRHMLEEVETSLEYERLI